MPSDERTFIWVKFAKEGIHRYPAALEDPKLEDVRFLGYPHRHNFGFIVSIEVFHNDREIEFLQFKKWLQSLFSEDIIDIDYKSVEMLADDVAEKIYDKYPNRDFSISVSEDDENGCLKHYKKV